MTGLDLRFADSRGAMQLGWLDARFSFSFGPYRNPARNGFGDLLALNEDRVQPGAGFPMHPHQNLEIIVIPLTCPIEHRDSLGQHAVVQPGEIQRMSAGSGIWHSQMNMSTTEVDHHLQIWLRPRTRNARPFVEQRSVARAARLGRWQAYVTPEGRDGSLPVDQDASIHATILKAEQGITFAAAARRSAYLHVVSGTVRVTGAQHEVATLGAADAIAFPVASDLRLVGVAPESEVLLFDLARTGSSELEIFR